MRAETNRHRHVSAAAFLRRLAGSCSEEERGHIDAHTPGCGACRGLYQGLALAHGQGTVEEEALIAAVQRSVPTSQLVARLLAQPGGELAVVPTAAEGAAAQGGVAASAQQQEGRSRGRVERQVRWGRRRLSLGLAAAAAVASLFVLSLRPIADEGARLTLTATHLDMRAIEGRSALFVGYAPHAAVRGDLDEAQKEAARREAASAREVAEGIGGSGLAGFYLYQGQPGGLALADRALQQLPKGPERNNEEALLLLSRGSPREAVALLEHAAAQAPGLLAARFNLALALEAVGDQEGAIGAWEGYLLRATPVVSEGAWIEEAVERLERLRGKHSG